MTATAIKERPILFSPTMAEKVHRGEKTQTRRVVKPSPESSINPVEWQPGCWQWATIESRRRCPYGVAGDRLWVRESAIYWTYGDGDIGGETPVVYSDDETWDGVLRDIKLGPPKGWKIDGDQGWWRRRPSIHMPRAFCRTVLEITEVRVQRLHDIGKDGRKAADVLAEGIDPDAIKRNEAWFHPDDAPALAFGGLWESINGKGSWKLNPWVWAITFRKVSP